MTNTLIVITGPTGVGKTELCLEVAHRYDTSIINADSRQIFKEIPIGTAAPTPEQRARVAHHLVGNHSIHDYYSAALFEQEALETIQAIFNQGKHVAILSGGSMMYIDAVCKGIDDIPTITEATRSLFKKRLEEEGLEALCEELKQCDPEHYGIVDLNNRRRVIHALEICHQTGRTYTSFRTNQAKQRPFDIIKIALNIPREQLYERINNRVLDMIAYGLEAEARKVYPFRHLDSLNTVGYREMFAYFDGTYSLEEAIRRIQGNTRRYARKQLTWFKRDPSVVWFHPQEMQEIIRHIDLRLCQS